MEEYEGLALRLYETLKVKNEPPSFVDDLSAKINSIYVQSSKVSSSSETYKDSKSEDAAKAFRKAGIASARVGNYAEALISYAKSLASAPEDSRELYETYDERSLLMLRLQKYDDCVMDVNRALAGRNCPKYKKRKLHARKKECFERYRETTGYPMEDLITTLDKERCEWRKFSALSSNSMSAKVEFIPGFDGCDWSSLVRAAKDIEPGEIVSVEELFCTQLDSSRYFTHCAYCLVKCHCLIPCPSCKKAMYCSERCLSSADDAYHLTECKMMNFFNRENNSKRDSLLLRMFLRGTYQGQLLPTMMKKLPPSDIFKENGDGPYWGPCALDYSAFMNLCFRMFDDKPIIECAENALHSIVDIVLALRNLSFFPGNTKPLPDRFSEVELYAALLLVRDAIILQLYDFRIPMVEDYKTTLFGFGVYIVQAHLNMSCNPNTQMFIENRQRVLFATRPIKAGEPLFYSNHLWSWFANHPKSVRAFWCECEACIKDWPCREALRDLSIRPLREIENDEPLWKKLDATLCALMKPQPLDRHFTEFEIRQIIIDLIKFLYNNVETKPSYELVYCEVLLSQAMEIFCSDLYPRELIPRFVDYLKYFVAKLKKRLIVYEVNKSTSSGA